MHTEEYVDGTPFGVESLNELELGQAAFLWMNGSDYYFLVKTGEDEYIIKEIETLEDSDISDRMREDFDDHEAWVNAVRNWDTDDSYDNWRQDIDIWEECDSSNYYECGQKFIEILYNLWMWSYDDDACDHNGYYLDEYYTWTVSTQILETVYSRFDRNQEFNQKLWSELENKYGVNQVQYLDCEDIR